MASVQLRDRTSKSHADGNRRRAWRLASLCVMVGALQGTVAFLSSSASSMRIRRIPRASSHVVQATTAAAPQSLHPKSKLHELMASFLGGKPKKEHLKWSILSNSSGAWEVEVMLPAYKGQHFSGNGTTRAEAEAAAASAAVKHLGKFKRISTKANLTNTKTFAKYLSRQFRHGVEVAEVQMETPKEGNFTESAANLLYTLAYLNQISDEKGRKPRISARTLHRVEPQRGHKDSYIHALRVLNKQKVRMPAEPEVVKVGKDTKPSNLAGLLLRTLRHNITGVELQLLGNAAAENAVEALERMEHFANHTSQFHFSSRFLYKDRTGGVSNTAKVGLAVSLARLDRL